jgi:GT2 family glycosyltransferase
MKISAVVPVWNGRELLARLLASLAAQTLPAGEVLVVDNGSSDGAPDVARAAGARVIAMGRNAGFAAAVNRGIRESRGEWIAVLNNDVEVAPDYFEKLSAADAWFATGKILSSTAATPTIDGAFDLLSRAGAAWRAGSGFPDGPLFAEPRPIWSPPWTAVLFRAELFRKTGMLEESFESYLEDVDFGLRCARAGMAGLYLPDAVAWHRGSATLGRWHRNTVRRMARNQVLLLVRHYPRRLVLRWLWPILTGQSLWGLVALRHGCGWAWSRGKWDGLRRVFGGAISTDHFAPAVLEHLLVQNEGEIRAMQSSVRYDLYWKLYFLLTRGGTK